MSASASAELSTAVSSKASLGLAPTGVDALQAGSGGGGGNTSKASKSTRGHKPLPAPTDPEYIAAVKQKMSSARRQDVSAVLEQASSG